MKTILIILFCMSSISASRIHMYLKDVIDNSKNIIIAKVTSLEAKGNHFSKAEVQTLEVLKGTASSSLSFKPDSARVYDYKNIHNGEMLILLFNKEKRSHTIPACIRMNSFVEDDIRKTELLYWIIYPVQMQSNIAENDSINRIKYLELKEDKYQHTLATFDTLVHTIKLFLEEPSLLRIKKGLYHKYVVPPSINEIRVFINDNKLLNKTDSLALFNGRYLPGVKDKVVLFNLGDPQAILHENGMEMLRYSKLLEKEFMFKNGSLLLIREIQKE